MWVVPHPSYLCGWLGNFRKYDGMCKLIYGMGMTQDIQMDLPGLLADV